MVVVQWWWCQCWRWRSGRAGARGGCAAQAAEGDGSWRRHANEKTHPPPHQTAAPPTAHPHPHPPSPTAIGECRSKAEEDRIIAAELETLRSRLSDPKLDRSRGREYMVRVLYCDMLGHDASFAAVPCLRFASDAHLPTKKAAYLALAQLLHPGHELVLLLVNTLLSDLKSDNFVVACAALVAVTKLIDADLVGAVLPAVVRLLFWGGFSALGLVVVGGGGGWEEGSSALPLCSLSQPADQLLPHNTLATPPQQRTPPCTHLQLARLSDPKEAVRRKAVAALHRFVLLDPHRTGPLAGVDADRLVRTALCDKDPSVMAAALGALSALAAADPAPYRSLVPSLASILKQVGERRLPKGFDHHRVPAPFIRIRLLRALARLGAGDRAASEQMAAVVGAALERPGSGGGGGGATIANAVVYEAVR